MRSRHPQEKLLNDFSLLCGSCGCGSGWIPLRLHLPDQLPVLQFTSAAKVEGFLPWKSWQGLYTDNTYETWVRAPAIALLCLSVIWVWDHYRQWKNQLVSCWLRVLMGRVWVDVWVPTPLQSSPAVSWQEGEGAAGRRLLPPFFSLSLPPLHHQTPRWLPSPAYNTFVVHSSCFLVLQIQFDLGGLYTYSGGSDSWKIKPTELRSGLGWLMRTEEWRLTN